MNRTNDLLFCAEMQTAQAHKALHDFRPGLDDPEQLVRTVRQHLLCAAEYRQAVLSDLEIFETAEAHEVVRRMLNAESMN